jgi:hypothetical protein
MIRSPLIATEPIRLSRDETGRPARSAVGKSDFCPRAGTLADVAKGARVKNDFSKRSRRAIEIIQASGDVTLRSHCIHDESGRNHCAVEHALCAIFAVKIALPLLVAVSTFKRQEWVARVAERSKN